MDTRSIGIFDSGLGGLTTVKEMLARLPGEDIIYFGDTGRVPYGTRGDATIIRYVEDDIRFLINRDVKLIIAACGTASAVALPSLKGKTEVPVIGVVEPASRRAASVSRNGRIGVLGTGATINSGKYEEEIRKILPSAVITKKACPLFVPLVENGHTEDRVARLVAEEYLAPLKEAGVDTVILGCTHYPLLQTIIREIMGDDVTLINPGEETVRYALSLLDEMDGRSDKEKGECEFFVSDLTDSFIEVGSSFLGRKIDCIKEVKIGE